MTKSNYFSGKSVFRQLISLMWNLMLRR